MTDCIVVGGGIAGLTTARELVMRGISVALIEQGRLGQEASWAAGGILSSMRPWSEAPESARLSHESIQFYPQFIQQLTECSGIDTEYSPCGLLMINPTDISAFLNWTRTIEIDWSDVPPSLPRDFKIIKPAVFLPHIAQIRVPRLLKALKQSLLNYRVEISENTKITQLHKKYNTCTFIETEAGKQYTAKAFIFTVGAWSNQITNLNTDKVTPVLGQMLCVKFAKPDLATMILDGGHYFIPRQDGHVLIGSTIEYIGFKQQTSKLAHDKLMEWATQLWPAISQASLVNHWAGLRPKTETGTPLLGRLPDYKNVFVNAGHFRKGILQAPLCAKKIADTVEEVCF